MFKIALSETSNEKTIKKLILIKIMFLMSSNIIVSTWKSFKNQETQKLLIRQIKLKTLLKANGILHVLTKRVNQLQTLLAMIIFALEIMNVKNTQKKHFKTKI